MASILLTTLNARYSHASLGLRYLLANMAELRPVTGMREFTINQRPQDIAEALLAERPRILGIGLYIWNIAPATELILLLKRLQPDLAIVIGGPQVSYDWQDQQAFQAADYLIPGMADLAFSALCRRLLAGDAPGDKVQRPALPEPHAIRLPYGEYDEEDIVHRLVHVEASRGCPFRCQFCLSALDRSVRPFPLAAFLQQMDSLYRKGLRQFKFVDRTFNLKMASALAILAFFRERCDGRLRLHFELIPDRLPVALKQAIAGFPAGVLQFEVGLQTFDPEVQQRIERRQDNARAEVNLLWLRRQGVHLHTDLIAGLPGESLASLAAGFDRLVALRVGEIQVGILKKLPGAPIARHDREWRMRYNPAPPFNLLANADLDFFTMQRLGRFARYWDLFANSGRFAESLPLLLGDAPFRRFMAFADWLYRTTGQTHRLQLDRQFLLLRDGLARGDVAAATALAALRADYRRTGNRLPGWLKP
jgi:radical SAM superfamily enzyme YgiQ (UPF0313 family)